jgi:hypothetical protein
MKRASAAFGAMLALLLVVALSVPIGPANAQGYSPTLLQFGLPLVLGGAVAALALVVVAKMYLAGLADRKDERAAFVTLQRNTSQDFRNAMLLQSGDYRHTLQTVTQQQSAVVEVALQMGALLVTPRDGNTYAQLPSGATLPVNPIEAEYWREIAPGQVADYIEEGK